MFDLTILLENKYQHRAKELLISLFKPLLLIKLLLNNRRMMATLK